MQGDQFHQTFRILPVHQGRFHIYKNICINAIWLQTFNIIIKFSLVRRYLGNQGSTTIKTEGNIHRLQSGGDDNDENNTWNGNSTQQM